MTGGELFGLHIDGEFIDWPRRPTIMMACVLFMLASIGAVSSRLVGVLMPLLPAWIHPALTSQLAGTLIQLLLFLLPVLLYWRDHPGVNSALRLRTPTVAAVFITFAAAGCGLLLSHYLGNLWLVTLQMLGVRLASTGAGADGTLLGNLTSMISLGLVPAVCEEMLFRGAILGAWERRGTTRALVLSSILFAILHGSVEALPVQLLLGFVLGYLAITTDSIYPAMLYHFAHNAGLIALSVGAGEQVQIGESLYYAMGGAAGVLKNSLTALILGVVFVFLMIAVSSERERSGRPFERPGPVDREPIRWQELLVLISGIVACIMLFFTNLLTSMRYI